MLSPLETFRRDKDAFFRESPRSPLAGGPAFAGLSYFPPDEAFVFEAVLEPFERPDLVVLETSTGDRRHYLLWGVARFAVEGEQQRLRLFATLDDGVPEEFFIPFRDATSGDETYASGRYLEAPLLASGRVLLDFNYAYHPFCAYSDRYSCPLPPVENDLPVPIRAGERLAPMER